MTITEIKSQFPDLVEFGKGHWGFPELVPYNETYGIIYEMLSFDGSKFFKNGKIGCVSDLRSVGSHTIQGWGNQKIFTNKTRCINHIKRLRIKAQQRIAECKNYKD